MSRGQHAWLWATVLWIPLPTPTAAQTADQIPIALQYVAAQGRVMEADADTADVDSLLSFVTDDFTYVHPAVDGRVEGKASARAEILSHLRETGDPTIRVSTAIEKGTIVTLVAQTSFRTREGQTVSRENTIVLVFRDGKIALRDDF